MGGANLDNFPKNSVNDHKIIKGEVTSVPWKSALALLLSNIFTIVVAVMEQWNLSQLMWIYWGQSVVIGYFNWKRIRCLRQFSTNGLTFNDRPVPATKIAQRQIANFFALHYGAFHFAYFMFLYINKTNLSQLEIISAGTCLAVFIFNHWFSFHQNLEKQIRNTPNIGRLMFFPYARVLPMHLTIGFCNRLEGQSTGTLILFLSLKTFADLTMHSIEHRGKNQREPRESATDKR